MKSKTILVFLTAIIAVTALAVFASATATGNLPITVDKVVVNDVQLSGSGSPDVSFDVGETIPIRVVMTATDNVSLGTLRVKILGKSIEASTGEFNMEAGHTYTKLLSLTVPANLKVSPSDEFTLEVTVESQDGDYENSYGFTVQRQAYNLEILSVDSEKSVQAGSTMNVDVVVKNTGSEEAQDTFVTVSIPSLDISRKVYFNDLTPTDNCDDCNKQDSVEGIVSLKIPSDVKAGVYDLQVLASDGDTTVKTTKSLSIVGLEQGSDVLMPASAKDVSAGSTVTYDLIIVNSGNRIAVYNIVPESAQNLVVSVDQPIVTVPADSSAVVKVTVQAGNVMGTFNFAVDVNSQGQLVKKVNLVANVVKGGITGSNNVIILTVVLAIIFIVLLVVLIVLLTRKPAKSEEFEESYY